MPVCSLWKLSLHEFLTWLFSCLDYTQFTWNSPPRSIVLEKPLLISTYLTLSTFWQNRYEMTEWFPSTLPAYACRYDTTDHIAVTARWFLQTDHNRAEEKTPFCLPIKWVLLRLNSKVCRFTHDSALIHRSYSTRLTFPTFKEFRFPKKEKVPDRVSNLNGRTNHPQAMGSIVLVAYLSIIYND